MAERSRREILKAALRTVVAGGLTASCAYLFWRAPNEQCASGSCQHCQLRDCPHRPTRWQIDVDKCIQCGLCATTCVLTPSAVKCVHVFSHCGYCDLCSGYFIKDARNLDTAAENQLCPVGAIKRRFIEDPYFEYTIDEDLCLGCGRCVKSCAAYGNGSLTLQVRHDRCVNCNECSIARQCPAGAFSRVEIERG